MGPSGPNWAHKKCLADVRTWRQNTKTFFRTPDQQKKILFFSISMTIINLPMIRGGVLLQGVLTLSGPRDYIVPGLGARSHKKKKILFSRCQPGRPFLLVTSVASTIGRDHFVQSNIEMDGNDRRDDITGCGPTIYTFLFRVIPNGACFDDLQRARICRKRERNLCLPG